MKGARNEIRHGVWSQVYGSSIFGLRSMGQIAWVLEEPLGASEEEIGMDQAVLWGAYI